MQYYDIYDRLKRLCRLRFTAAVAMYNFDVCFVGSVYLTSETQRRMNMAKTKILLMADGGLTPDIYKQMYDLEALGAEITLMVDEDIATMEKTMDRMHACEYEGIAAAKTYKPMLDVVEDKDIIVVHMTSVNREVLDHCKNLKVVACLRGGYENVDVAACTEKGVKVINAPWRSAFAVADCTVGMMIAENKNIARRPSGHRPGRLAQEVP